MKYLLLPVTVAAVFAAPGCSRRSDQTTPGSSPGAATVAARHWTAEEQKAVDLARAFLTKQGTEWGSPERVVRGIPGDLSGVGKGEDTFVVSYLTPVQEQRVVGPRAVRVNVQTGLAEFVPRD